MNVFGDRDTADLKQRTMNQHTALGVLVKSAQVDSEEAALLRSMGYDLPDGDTESERIAALVAEVANLREFVVRWIQRDGVFDADDLARFKAMGFVVDRQDNVR